MEWSAAQYKKFEAERALPSRDLANAIPLEDPRSAIDIGCGTGMSTAALKERFPGARVIGADSSENMLAAAREKHPELEFFLFDAQDGAGAITERFDIVFSNACIQWIPDHKALLPRLAGFLREGGVLAVQVPQQHKQPVRAAMEALAASGRWEGLPKPEPSNVLGEEEYFDILAGAFRDFRIWETTYCHAMPSHRAILEWYKGTALRPYLAALPEEGREEFEQALLGEIEKIYPVRQAGGEILFRFPRLFLMGIK